MSYVDGYVVPVKKDRIEDYRRIAAESSALFKEYGALAVVESLAFLKESIANRCRSTSSGMGSMRRATLTWHTCCATR